MEEILHNKYLNDKILSQVTAKLSDSQFWKGLMRVKDVFFFNKESFVIGKNRRLIFGRMFG
jgi:hypothetical protein